MPHGSQVLLSRSRLYGAAASRHYRQLMQDRLKLGWVRQDVDNSKLTVETADHAVLLPPASQEGHQGHLHSQRAGSWQWPHDEWPTRGHGCAHRAPLQEWGSRVQACKRLEVELTAHSKQQLECSRCPWVDHLGPR